jgi:CheY-like chemotaxis protein
MAATRQRTDAVDVLRGTIVALVGLTRHYEYDIVLLDLMLPDIEGYEVVRRMRLARNDTPDGRAERGRPGAPAHPCRVQEGAARGGQRS